MDSNPRTLAFFVDDEVQKSYIVNIPSAVRLFAFFIEKNSSFEILKYEYLSKPSAKPQQKGKLQWGQTWEFKL
ncbi:MAG: hypothetical protein EZS28_019321 [Streblomastix strix]|uniref:Uncharacterized protein n=1 Tax=Streblomastix strix TaxID=222440 RepID=A0A5J4VRG7_9EUKA|nr:MAG: hypothetical protein EZS28_019321 [Streblomastix strix]